MQTGLYICYDMILINAAIQLLPQHACSCFALFSSSCVIFCIHDALCFSFTSIMFSLWPVSSFDFSHPCYICLEVHMSVSFMG
jgi:hypothetical protein